MNQLEKIQISDCTLLDAADHAELSFREKIELCRLIDKLGVSTIDLCGIRQKKIDRLLIKSICSAVKNAMIAVPVSLIEEESVQMTWEALREARSARLQVVAPVSSVQMEYLLHMKPAGLASSVEKTIRECKSLTDEVEFIAADATRSDPAFLRHILKTAADAGVTCITLCDTAGVMTPEETYDFVKALRQEVPELKDVVVGFFCSGALNLADACAYAAVRAGARALKATSCRGDSISLANIVRILSVKGSSEGVQTAVGVEQIRRITGQAEMICHSAGHKGVAFSEQSGHETDLILSVHDSMDTVMHACETLGYDLSPEDQQKIWKVFSQTAEKKETVTLRELDAIIAAEAMQVPPAYHNIQYVINTGNQIGAMAHMKLMYHNQEIEGIASGDGAIDAAFNSIEQATGRHFELDDFQIQSVTEGREAMGQTIVRLRWEGKLYSGRGISTDIVGAGIMAYINAVNKIIYEEEET
ncbi:MAG: alpha-isopropylmalate synthase regulatory domain-containing protein [Eubacteriales bacterium]